MTLPVLHLSGTPYEQGVQHGRQLQAQIAHNLAIYFDRFWREANVSQAEVLQRAARYAAAIATDNAGYHAGMAGIAAGSGFSLAEIAALNVRYEILYYNNVVTALAKGTAAPPVDGCTAFAVAPAGTSNQHLLLGQNWDWIPEVRGALLHTSAPGQPATLAFTEAGIFGGKIGLNEAGLGLAINGITSMDDDWTRLSKPFHVRCYEILRQWTFAAAVNVVVGPGRACSANFLIAQVPDLAVDIEAAPQADNQLTWDDGCLVHTNHFVDPAGLGITEPDPEYRVTSCRRYDRMQELLRRSRPVSIPLLQNYLQDHTTPPKTICRHEDPAAPIDERYSTITAIIMDLHQRTLHITDGPPCENPFQEYALQS
ncbi:MAG: peptidase C45 [Ardenticatenaceae bacterium]|nr:peptidase C45 [Ardenticatenaceae bacterium]